MTPHLTLRVLREHAIAASLFPAGTLRGVISRLGFVQTDPIQCPARAHDLILRHRVVGYRAGDLERQYEALQLEEDRLYAFGFVPRSTWQLLHPRVERALTPQERRVLDAIIERNRLQPRDLDGHSASEPRHSGWGAGSKATTRILHSLHYRGFLRVAARVNGTHVYEAVTSARQPFDPADRFRQLTLLTASLLAPISDISLRATLGYVAFRAPMLRGLRSVVSALIESGDLAMGTLDGIRYVWPARHAGRHRSDDKVRFLSPFDPLVWDRHRFEHLWGWPYRFEAYVPAAKRRFGYYAMPMLWRDAMIGWVNVSNASGTLSVERGFVGRPPRPREFSREFDAEVQRLHVSLQRRPNDRDSC